MNISTLTIGATMAAFSGIASANLITNGDFEAGDTGFLSGYAYEGDVFQNSLQEEGEYAVGTNPYSYHSSWANFGDHTSGVGNMMIVNGTSAASTNVWSQNLSLAAGTYEFSAWARSTYFESPANLQVSLGGDSFSYQLSASTGAWEHITHTFTLTSATSLAVVDLELAPSGNDFALDDLSLTSTSSGPTVPDGGVTLALLGMSLGGMSLVRRKAR